MGPLEFRNPFTDYCCFGSDGHWFDPLLSCIRCIFDRPRIYNSSVYEPLKLSHAAEKTGATVSTSGQVFYV